MYKFKRLTKITNSDEHLSNDAPHSFFTGKVDLEKPENSDFPQELKSLSKEDWKRLIKGETIQKTEIQKITFTIEKS